MTFRLHRRAFLRGTGGAIISLPLLQAMFSDKAIAAGAADPKRFICMYIPNGTYISGNNGVNWFVDATLPLSAGNLPVTFEPFAAQMLDFSILKGIYNRAADDHYNALQAFMVGGQHSAGISAFLSCDFPDNNDPVCRIFSDSFDQIAAAKLGGASNQPLLMCGGAISGQVADSTAFHYGEFLSYKGGAAIAPYKNPVSLWTDKFSSIAPPGSPPPPPPVLSTLVRNKSVLDSAVGDINALQARLGKTDRQKLDDYLTSLRALETQLTPSTMTGPPPVQADCAPMPKPQASLNSEDYWGDMLDFPQRLQAFNDMAALALKCDMTRSIAITFDTEAAGRKFKNKVPAGLIYQGADMNDNESHIAISHYTDDPAKPARCVTRDRFYLSYFFSLMQVLKATQDPSGASMLDNTVILCGHGIVDGDHDYNPSMGFPLVIGGGSALGLHPGNAYSVNNGDMTDLLYTLNIKLGMGLTSFRGSSKLIDV